MDSEQFLLKGSEFLEQTEQDSVEACEGPTARLLELGAGLEAVRLLFYAASYTYVH